MSKPPPASPSQHPVLDRCCAFVTLSGALLRCLRQRAGIFLPAMVQAGVLPEDELMDIEAGVVVPTPAQLDRIADALYLTRDEIDAELRRVIATLEARGTWVFLVHPWDRPPELRLRTRSPEGVTWAFRPILVTGEWLREEVFSTLFDIPQPARTPLDQALAWADAYGWDTDPPGYVAPGPVRLPSLRDVSAALDRAAALQPPDDCAHFAPGDGTAVGDALAFDNMTRRIAGARHVASLTWFDHRASPRIIAETSPTWANRPPAPDWMVLLDAQDTRDTEDWCARLPPHAPGLAPTAEALARLAVTVADDHDEGQP